MKKIIMMTFIGLLCCLWGNVADAAEPADFWQYEKNIERVADPFAGQIMKAINEADYNSFQSNNSVKMKAAFSEAAFKKMASDLKEKVGECKEKEVMSIELGEEYMIVNYKVIFSKTADPLLMRVVLMKENGSTCVGGLWFNQLKLVGHTDPNPFK